MDFANRIQSVTIGTIAKKNDDDVTVSGIGANDITAAAHCLSILNQNYEF